MAIDDFGTPSLVARAFAGKLAGVQACRISVAYLLTGPMVGVSWLLLLAPLGWWQRGSATLWTSIPAPPPVAVPLVLGLLVLRGPIASWLQIASASAGAVRMSSSPTTQSDSTTGQWLFRLYPEGVAHDGVPC